MRGYTTRDVAGLIGLTTRQVQEYGRSGILDPDRDDAGRYIFSFQDLVLLRTARALLEARLPQRRILRSLRLLKDQLPTGRSLTEVRITADGDEVVVTDNGRSWEPESGQLRFSFDVAELADQVAPLARRAIEESAAAGDTVDEWLELGLELEVQAPAQARRAYRKALELSPSNPDALVNLGRLLQEDGELEEAASLYARAIESSGGDHPTAAFNLGIAFEDLGRDGDAAEAYGRALDADPAFADAHFNLSRVLERQGDKVSALRHLKSYRALTRAGG
ncbi:MAG TPA: tetratricopeptide repeat protein [Longimicrobiales bacterium]|nr:tetratricopeptide repeat protein [Longimicrobiales bacterium]